ncbi:Phycobilisome linker polypeptide (plasmid) [Thalassoporum mexicanum PCC 7367]|uniref:phycobilisome rod-core linker polypeptide n=1 Tax=Thalassoporum mexicanum TaxID=3457544 RepID=UPI00029FFA8C|nr:phycobilisome rod-core linker polypeptide [Pseudanabaena sp. PCC 7367]AFY72096.1 Phycobilisome linker polypeptide [Pseudanabaena sp. PCC 7367]
MAIPLLDYSPTSRNTRVTGYEVASEEQPKIYSTSDLPSASAIEDVIWAAYRQIFSEHQLLESNRQPLLESQFKFGQISARDFIRGLATCDTFRRLNYDANSNYRFSRMMVQRILGRDFYNKREELAWSITLCTKGLNAFIDQLVDSDEYLDSFGDDTIPYQRRRILPQRKGGEVPFNLETPRYGDYTRAKLGFPQVIWQTAVRTYMTTDRKPKVGDPANFLNMARTIAPRGGPAPRVSAQNIDLNKVPYRKR